ncbi:MAG: nitrate reductase [Acidiphilium sp.]
MTRTTCPYCGVGCGVTAGQGGIIGDADHPANRGRLCVKGANLAQTLDDRARLVSPTIRGRPAGWDEALDAAARGFADAIAGHGPDSVAFYVSGQFLTEDYYVANKLMKGFIGSANIDTNSRLCMASPVAAHRRAFGEDIVPGIYADFDEADLILFAGSNAAWCHPVLFQRALRARETRGTRLVVIDPRRSATAELADLHIPVEPGGDLALFAALLAACAERGALDRDYIAAHTNGFTAALDAAQAADPGIDPALFDQLATLVAGTPRMVTAFSQGVNQSETATDAIAAIVNLHLATGRIGKPGAAPFSLTGQPNAMGGREVGGLANQLAAHLAFENPGDHAVLSRFWNAPNLARAPGLKAVDMFEAVHDGSIRAIWIAGTNPAESLPRADRVREALERCPHVVVADCWPNATTERAHVVLPAAGWSEKDGTVTNSERTISRQRAFREAPGMARPDWWMFAELAKQLGHAEAFGYDGPAAIFREHAALSAFENRGTRAFDLAPLAAIPDEDYDALRPLRWPLGADRLFADGNFPTEDGRARFIPVRPPPAKPAGLVLNTGRLRDQWHTMTRTGAVPALMAHREAATAEFAPLDAARLGIESGDLVTLEGAAGRIVIPAAIEPGQRPGAVFAAIHWTGAQGSAGTINRLIPAATDPVSGQPAFKHGRVTATPVETFWHGIAMAREATLRPGVASRAAWSRTPREGDIALFRFAGFAPLEDCSCREAVGSLFDLPEMTIDYADARRGVFRLASMRGPGLALVVHLAPKSVPLPTPDALERLFASPIAGPAALLAGRDLAPPRGRMVCVCHNVAEPEIRAAIAAGHTGIGAIGAATGAGTGCGSCHAELRKLLRHDIVAA